jgi:hypothetical protein
VNWASLLLAVVLGTPAVVMFLRHKAPRTAAILAALAVLCLLSGIPSLMATIGHPIPPGPFLLGVVAVAIVCGMFFYLDVIRGEHKSPVFKGKGGAAAGAAGGGGKHNHHIRPLVSCVGLALAGLMIAMNWSAVISGTGNGFTQTVNTITRQQ